MAITFTLLGVVASILGKMMGTSNSRRYIILGVLMVLMTLQTWGILRILVLIAGTSIEFV